MAVKVIWSTEVQAGKVSDAHSAFETAKTLAKEDGIDMTVGQEILGGDRVFYLFGEYESLSDYESKMKEAEKNKGWEEFTDKVISTISELKEGVVFLLWGKFAQNKQKLIHKNKHQTQLIVHYNQAHSTQYYDGQDLMRNS